MTVDRCRRRRVPWRDLATMVLLLSLSGCRGCPKGHPPIHLNPNMDNQPKARAQAASDFFADGATMRTPMAGTVARGAMPLADPFHTGRQGESYVHGIPTPVDAELLARGVERYGIYCTPCHSDSGNGRGALYQRAQIESANLTEGRLVEMPAGQLFETISNGLGLMPAYDYVLPVADRWAIVAHVRTLQGLDAMTLSVPNQDASALDSAEDVLDGTEPDGNPPNAEQGAAG